MFRPTYFLMKSFSGAIKGRGIAGQTVKFTEEFIRNAEFPFCVNCIYFLDHGRCKKFGEADLITGLIKYDPAILCRKNDDKCGSEGYEYEAKSGSITT